MWGVASLSARGVAVDVMFELKSLPLHKTKNKKLPVLLTSSAKYRSQTPKPCLFPLNYR